MKKPTITFPSGPYYYEDSRDDSFDIHNANRYIAGIQVHEMDLTPDTIAEAEAIARLFAAAPEMLTACKLALTVLESVLENDDMLARTQMEWEAEPLATLRVVIAKAEGIVT